MLLKFETHFIKTFLATPGIIIYQHLVFPLLHSVLGILFQMKNYQKNGREVEDFKIILNWINLLSFILS